jgi:hypothetical protein
MEDCLPRFHKQSMQKGFPQRQISGSTNLSGTISGEAMHCEASESTYHPFSLMLSIPLTVCLLGHDEGKPGDEDGKQYN